MRAALEGLPFTQGEYRKACAAPGCEKEHHCRGLCWLHYQRMRRTGRLGVTQEQDVDPWDRLELAALEYADADGDEEWKAAKEKLIDAARAYRRQLPARRYGKAGRAA